MGNQEAGWSIPEDQTGENSGEGVVNDPFKPANEVEERLLALFADAVAPTVRRLFHEGQPNKATQTENPPPPTPEEQ